MGTYRVGVEVIFQLTETALPFDWKGCFRDNEILL